MRRAIKSGWDQHSLLQKNTQRGFIIMAVRLQEKTLENNEVKLAAVTCSREVHLLASTEQKAQPHRRSDTQPAPGAASLPSPSRWHGWAHEDRHEQQIHARQSVVEEEKHVGSHMDESEQSSRRGKGKS